MTQKKKKCHLHHNNIILLVIYMNNIILKDLLFDIQSLENENQNYTKKTNDIILNLIENIKSDNDIEIQLYSPTKNSNIEFLKSIGKYKRITKKNYHLCNSKCSICLENYKNNEYYRKLPICKHIFHKKCIDKWFKLSHIKKCPICDISYDKNFKNFQSKQYISL